MRNAFALSIVALLFAAGCGSTKPESQTDADKLTAECATAKTEITKVDPSIVKWFDTAHAYALFPSIGKGAIGIGGAYGRGEVHETKKLVGYSTIKQATIGFQLGGQAFTEVIFFKDAAALKAFQEGNFQFAANASAVAVKSGAGATSEYSDGVKAFVHVKGGLMAEASVGGQKFAYENK
jgi:lipid-binding SYLF domain-containing protein